METTMVTVLKCERTARRALIYFDRDYRKYRVEFYDAMGYLRQLDYFTRDQQDAMDTAEHWIAG